ncbi:hypothetical protein SEVIR_6G109500v4 [Setaria viridis]|uniref:Nuclear pore complex protein NUP43 n=1 Tax=Setaria italica TaxID=4555 RepID=A0A368RKA4_SETIT|nr:hypothetical protein SETIT_6G099900v2 [Setaria italica]
MLSVGEGMGGWWRGGCGTGRGCQGTRPPGGRRRRSSPRAVPGAACSGGIGGRGMAWRCSAMASGKSQNLVSRKHAYPTKHCHALDNYYWGRGIVTGMVHSIDIHSSRKHICVVGGSSGTIFAWDLRWPQQPIPLSGVGLNGTAEPVCESEVWEVHFDTYTQSSDIISSASSKILPVMMCSEDGILAVVKQDERPLELLAEACAINSFDIDPQNPSDVVCALEWESIGVLTRDRDTLVEE